MSERQSERRMRQSHCIGTASLSQSQSLARASIWSARTQIVVGSTKSLAALECLVVRMDGKVTLKYLLYNSPGLANYCWKPARQEAILEQSRSLKALCPRTENAYKACLKKLKEDFKTGLELPDWEDFFREYGSVLPANPIILGHWKGFAQCITASHLSQFTRLTMYMRTDLAQELGLTTAAHHKPVAIAVNMQAVLMQAYNSAYNWSLLAQCHSFKGMLKIMTHTVPFCDDKLDLKVFRLEVWRTQTPSTSCDLRDMTLGQFEYHLAAIGRRAGIVEHLTPYAFHRLAANALNCPEVTSEDRGAAMGHNACSAAYRAYHARTAQINVQGLVAHGSRQEVFGAADVKHLQEAVRDAQATFKSLHAGISIRQGKQLGYALAKAIKSPENDLSHLINTCLLAQWRKEVAAAVESENLRAFAPQIAELATAAALRSTVDGILLDAPSRNGVDVLSSLGNADLRDSAALRANVEEELEVDLDLGLDIASIQAQPTAPRTHFDTEPNVSLVPPTRFALAHANHAHMQATLKGGRDLESDQYLALLRQMLNKEMLHGLPLARATPSAEASVIPALEAMEVFTQCPLPEGKNRKTPWQGCGNVSGDDVAELVWHVGTQHTNLAKGTPCRLCSKRFGSANDGYCHYEAEHNVVFASAAHRKLAQPPAIKEIVASITHRCKLCHKTLLGRAALLYHCMAHQDEFKHRGVPLPLPGASADLAKAGVCPICMKSDLPAVNAVTTFSRMQSLSEHLQTVHIHKDMEKPFVQERCPYPMCATRCGTYVDFINHLVKEHCIAIFGMQEKE
ncbi:hypothetical protein IE81DRAFT_332884 [Ceraceosorus guamensis]|uniref:C2H2-type domain-containing protein n=1 Tax=Ceraceosorus guamensis TaxID=1522189 RepID=A0A316VMX0_9BASI|nr:hypothetical protein IE81DRAFT_332884 [Ceraceosorus guamensis]PWN38660.1 hypothetical protein IE81DRAFT_332884 [Ceraceosorus guamensis]